MKHEIVLKDVPSSGTRVEELQQEKAILDFWSAKGNCLVDRTVTEDLTVRTAQKWQQT